MKKSDIKLYALTFLLLLGACKSKGTADQSTNQETPCDTVRVEALQSVGKYQVGFYTDKKGEEQMVYLNLLNLREATDTMQNNDMVVADPNGAVVAILRRSQSNQK